MIFTEDINVETIDIEIALNKTKSLIQIQPLKWIRIEKYSKYHYAVKYNNE